MKRFRFCLGIIILSSTLHAENLTQAKDTPPVKSATTSEKATPAPATPNQAIDCNYRIPAETSQLDPSLISKWAEKAAEQSFDFNYATIDQQLDKLKNCYTEQGWQGFHEALQKSGNLSTIKAQKLMVHSSVSGASTISAIKDNQWKVILPLQVVYQNDKEKLTQSLIINLVIGRKLSGDLGIMQLVAHTPVPEPTANPQTTPPAPQTTPQPPVKP